MKLELLETGPIDRNPDPGHRHYAAMFPHPLELPGGELLCAYNRGSAMYAVDLSFHLARSGDGGRSWRAAGALYDRAADARPYSYHDPFLSRMADGALLVGAFRMDRSDPGRPMFSERGGLQQPEVIILRSADAGRSWGAPEVVAMPAGIVATPASAILALADGAWLWAFDQWSGYDDLTPYSPRTLALFSRDGGRSWGDMLPYADGADEGKGFWHGKPIRLGDGRLLTVYWAADMATGANLPNHLSLGDRHGRDWTRPTPIGVPGQTNAVVDLGHGRLCMVYTRREGDGPGIMAALSEDGGASWDLEGQARLWDATGRDRIGVVSLESYPRSHDTIAFGAPALTRLGDGTLYAAWWCMEAGVVHTRWARLKATG